LKEATTESENIVVDKDTEIEIITREKINEEDDLDTDHMAKLFSRFQIGEDLNNATFVGFSEQTNTLK